jgi:hypothetical protein
MLLRKWSFDEFIDSYDSPQQRARYTAAKVSLEVNDLTRKDSDVKTFVKAEKVNFSKKLDPAPRIISPRDPRYNISVGVYVKPIEGVLYGLLNDMCGGRTVMKGLNSLQTGEAVAEAWGSFRQPVGIGLDAKRFDQHTGPEALRFEQDVYCLFFTGEERRELHKLLSWQQRTRCKSYCADGLVSFDMNIRASGDMNTGLGTCLIACALIHSFCAENDITYRLINNGDDCVLLVERDDLPRTSGLFQHCKDAGYWMEIEEPVYQLEELVFCQTQPVFTARGWAMVRSFPSSISKDMVSLLPLTSNLAWRKWARDVGNCGSAINAGVPVLWSLYNSLARAGQGSFGHHPWVRNSGFFRMARGLESTRLPVLDEARLSFWRAFGVPPAEQKALEDMYDRKVYDFTPASRGQIQHTIQYLSRDAAHTLFNIYLDKFNR